MPGPLILLPPSEGKADGGTGAPWTTLDQSFPDLAEARHEVATALAAAMTRPVAERCALLGVKQPEAATAANLAVHDAPTRPAIERYTGVLYDALDYPSLPARLRKRVDARVVIFSGLWGALRPADPIPDYKLKMGAKLPGLGPPARFWKPRLTATLADAAAGCVWDLLPNEHSAAWDPSVAGRRIPVRFLDDVERGGARTLVTVAHWNKLLKGALVRFVLDEGLTDPGGLADFDHPQGYVYDPSLTTTEGAVTDVALVARR